MPPRPTPCGSPPAVRARATLPRRGRGGCRGMRGRSLCRWPSVPCPADCVKRSRLPVPPPVPEDVHTATCASLRPSRAYAPIVRGTPRGCGRQWNSGERSMTVEHPWLAHYPAGIPAQIDVDEFSSIPAVLEGSIRKYKDRPAFANMGKTLTYARIDELSRQFAAYLLGELKLKKGDRVAIMMPNCLQYPIATFGILRAGLTGVNVNPMYTPRELKHQLVDSGAMATLVLDNFGTTVQQALEGTTVKQVITTGLGDLLGFPKGAIVNFVLKYVKKMVPDYDIPGAIRFNDVLTLGQRHELPEVSITHDDIAFLQYTGGTTGVAKGAM